MKKFIINNGKFSDKAFSGYTAKGERIHVHARQMEALGFTKESEMKDVYPFYVIAEPKDYPARLDTAGQPIANADGTFGIKGRLTATAIFKSIDSLSQAFVDEATLDARVDNAINTAIKSYKLDTKSVGQLESAI